MSTSAHVPELCATMIGSDAVEQVWRVLAAHLEGRARNGMGPSAPLVAAVEALAAGAAEARRHASQMSDVGRVSPRSAAEAGPMTDIAAGSVHDRITTADLAAALHVSSRHALRKAAARGLVSELVGRSRLWSADAPRQIIEGQQAAS